MMSKIEVWYALFSFRRCRSNSVLVVEPMRPPTSSCYSRMAALSPELGVGSNMVGRDNVIRISTDPNIPPTVNDIPHLTRAET